MFTPSHCTGMSSRVASRKAMVMPVARRVAMMSFRRRTRLLAALGYAVELQAMVDQIEAELFGDAALQALDVLVDEFDHAARGEIDQMIVVIADLFVAGAAVAEIVALEN